MAWIKLAQGLAALRAGRRWWPAELAMRALGLLMLSAGWRVALTVHRLASTPAPHEASMGELAICAAIVVLLCCGLVLTFAGPVLFLDVPLPPHFTRPANFD